MWADIFCSILLSLIVPVRPGVLYIDDTRFDDLGGLCDVPFDWEVFAANGCFADRYDCSCCNECCVSGDVVCSPL